MNITDRIRITNEDNMALMARYPDKHFDLAIVDPPYGIGADVLQNAQSKSGRVSNGGRWKMYKASEWDSKIPDARYFNELERVSKNQIIWGGNYYPIHHVGVIVWYKGKNGDMKDGELAKTSIGTFKVYELSRIDAYVNGGDQKIHPTQKPVALYKWLLKNYATPDMKILDTHLGSGSIAIACHEFGCDLTACELDPDYYRDAIKRIQNHVSQANLFI